MNALTMKLENSQLLELTNEQKNKDLINFKKCKNIKKKTNTSISDKDASLNSHGLGRKFNQGCDLQNLNVHITPKHETSKKNKSRKVGSNIERMFSENDKIQEKLQRFLSNEDKEKISCILNNIKALSDIQKLYLYLQLPTGTQFEVDPLKQKTQNPLGKKADEEGMFATTWIQSHLEEDPDVSLPKQEVYEEYQSYCNMIGTDPLCAADFGKVMKQIFPSVKPRRLGTRGNSRYCYSGLKKKLKLAPPSVPDIQKEKENCAIEDNFGDEVTVAACHLLYEWAEKLLGVKFASLKDLAAHLLENMYVDNRSVAAFTVLLDASPQLLTKGFSSCEGTMKKTEAQFHLQRKIHEKELIKEQKQKLLEQRMNIISTNKNKSGLPKKKSHKSKKNRLPSTENLELICDKSSEKDDSKTNEILSLQSSEIMAPNTNMQSELIVSEINIKKEDNLLSDSSENIGKVVEQPTSQILVSPLSSPISNVETEESANGKGKIFVSRNKTPVCIPQSLQSIIIVPSLPQIQTEVGKQNLNTPKYKRIQPKPLQGEIFNTVSRSRAGSVGSSIPNKPKPRNDGRRSSHAWLQSDNDTEIADENLKTNSTTNTPFKLIAENNNEQTNISLKDSRFETPHCNEVISEELNTSNLINSNEISGDTNSSELIKPDYVIEIEDNNSIKRHLDENDTHLDNKRFHLDSYKISNESSWVDDIPDVHSINNNAQFLSKEQAVNASQEEVNVHEIEGDALNDYFRGSASSQNVPNILLQSDVENHSSTNKVKQLSQLRMLLQQNLPSAISKTTFDSIKNGTNENKHPNLSKNLIPNKQISLLQNSNKLLTNQNNSSNASVNNATKNYTEVSSLEKLLSSNYLAIPTEANNNTELLADPSAFLNPLESNIQDMDVNLQNELNQNSNVLFSSSMLSDAEFVSQQVNAAASYNRVSTSTQVPSVPQSPNTRRRAFNFMPISPRHTPVPEGIVNGHVSSPHLRTMMSTGVGPSQPPSNSGSPFVSPRSTPVPLCRSRHSSGQSTSRHTPFQNFDSGVSSVSSSPFISPQPTPIPVSRLRHNSSHEGSKTVTFCSTNSSHVMHASSASNNMPHLRTRHSSGPGATHLTNFSLCNALSPLVTEQLSESTFMFPSSNEVRSRHNSGSNTTTPSSPASRQTSSSNNSSSNMSDLLGINDISSISQSFLNDGAGDLLISANPSSLKQVRHRHASSSVIYGKSSYASKDILSQEIQKLLKVGQENNTSGILMTNRSQSVPLHQMLQTADGFCFLASQSIEDSCPKSHPSTPVNNQMFQFPVLGSTQDNLSVPLDVITRDKSLVQTSQMDWAGFDSSSELESTTARRNLAAMYDTAPLNDDLQTTLEYLRDCDTDFSKLELELRQNEENGL